MIILELNKTSWVRWDIFVQSIQLNEARRFPAKTVKRQEGQSRALGISVRQHGLIAAFVMRALLRTIRTSRSQELLPESLSALALLHDIGKINPVFLKRLLMSLSSDDPERSAWSAFADDEELAEIPHSAGSYATLRAMDPKNIAAAKVVGFHHGYPLPIRFFSADSIEFGGPSWEKVRETLAREMMSALESSSFPQIPKQPKDLKKALLDVWAGLVVVSDWIASQVETPIEEGAEEACAEALVLGAGFQKPSLDRSRTFADVFGFSPRPAQAAFMELYKGPGIYIFEAPTGYGKTEGALGLAWEAIRRGDASGIYFALPTQLTSNRIHTRFSRCVQAMVNKPEQAVRLIHSGARLLQTDMGKEGSAGDAWFNENRRAILAPYGVGTIDQALLSMLPIRFSTVRAAGLSGKVLILDEIHSYDAYTSSLIADFCERMKTLGNVVVVLSATLTNAMRNALLKIQDVNLLPNAGSPLRFTVCSADGIEEKEMPLEAESTKTVRVSLIEDDDAEAAAFAEALRRLDGGEQVLWIENTVDAAQRIYQKFKDQGEACGLLHSRFRAVDRSLLEDRWVSWFGKEGRESRGKGARILIGTQVLEQSLDIDADFMVSRYAPLDLLIQRMGRLWRHGDTPRPSTCTEPVCLIIARPESEIDDEDPLAQFGASGKVYGPPYILARTVEVLRNRLRLNSSLKLPNEVRGLLEAAYADREESEGSALAVLRKAYLERKSMLSLAALGAQSQITLNAHEGDDVEPSTRYIDRPAFPVIVFDPGEMEEAPDDPKKLALWLDRHIVKSPRPISAPSLQEARGFSGQFKKFRQSRLPAVVWRADGRLAVLGEPGRIIQDGSYSPEMGLSF